MTYWNDNTPPPTFRTHEDEDAIFRKQLEEATMQSREDYIRDLERRATNLEWENRRLRDYATSGHYNHYFDGAGPSRRHGSDSEDE